MNIQEKIKAELKSALQSKEEKKVSTLRMLISAIRNKEISLRKGEDVTLSDEQVLEVINSEVKKRRDSIQAYEDGNRPELAQIEKDEIEILEKYLPAQLGGEELEKIVSEIIEKSEDKNFGKIMGQVMGRVKGKADGNRVSAAVKKSLG